MSFCNSRKTVIRNLNDGHIVAKLIIGYKVDKQKPDEAVCVKLELSGEKGDHSTLFLCVRMFLIIFLKKSITG